MSSIKLITIILITLILLNLGSWANLIVVYAQTPPDLSGTQIPASCKKIGVNSASFYAQGDGFYQKAKESGMGWTIEIARANSEGAVAEGINKALANGLTPIIRIGLGSTSYGFINPADYVLFLNAVAARANGPFYAVAGPNEPEYEHWLAQETANDPGGDYNIGNENAPNQAGINRLGSLLANYMSAVANGGVDSKVSLLSPSLSVTAWSTVPIIQAMKNNGANFSAMAGFSGTSYSGSGGAADTRTQINKITGALGNIPIVFTEFNDGAANIATLKAIIDVAKADPNVKAALLFNAFNTNSGWSQFSLTDAELAQVLGPECVNLVELNKVARPVRTSVPCQNTTSPEFHPLRPYPGNPCDPLIPRSDPRADRVVPKSNQSWAVQLEQDFKMRNSVAFSCGNSLTPTVIHPYDKGNPNIPTGCTLSGRTVRCINRENFTLTLDLTDANLPILGNTQNQGLTDAQKMTEYLSWYLNGAVQHSEQDANPSTNRLVNYSGPLQKLLPQQLKEFIKDELLAGPVGQAFIPTNSGGQYHNYIVDDPTRLKDPAASLWEQIFRNVPFASLEDTTGEVVISVSDIEAHNQQDKDVIDAITPDTPLKLTIRKNATP